MSDDPSVHDNGCRKTYCEAIVAVFVFGPQRCYARPYADVVDDGETWTVCREHFQTWKASA